MSDHDGAASAVLAAQLAGMRERREGMSAAKLADRVKELGGKLDRVAISKIENGARGVSLDEALILAAALDIAPLHLFLPLDDNANARIAPEIEVSARQARRWVRGQEPLPGMDERIFRTEVPRSEWEAAQQPSAEEERAEIRVEAATHDLRVAERMWLLVSERPPEIGAGTALQYGIASGSLGSLGGDLHEERLDRALRAVAEAQVDLEDARRALWRTRPEKGQS